MKTLYVFLSFNDLNTDCNNKMSLSKGLYKGQSVYLQSILIYIQIENVKEKSDVKTLRS